MTLTYDPDAGLAPLEFAVSKNLNAKSDAERAARGLGWSKTKKTGWTCPSCKEKR